MAGVEDDTGKIPPLKQICRSSVRDRAIWYTDMGAGENGNHGHEWLAYPGMVRF